MTNKFSCFLTQKGRWLTATLFLLFTMGIGQMWADVTLFNVDFTDEASETISTSNSGATFVAKTYDGYNMSFGVKSGKDIDITNGTGINFKSNNINSYQCLAIPLTLTQGNEVTAVITLKSSGTIKYKWVSGSLPATPSVSSPSTYSPSSKTNTLSYTPSSAGDYVLYLGRSGDGNGSQYIESIVITQESSCSATANAGADKETTIGVGVTMAATAASDGFTGAWSIKSGSPSTDAGQLGTTSSNTMTFTPSTYGTYTLVWTVTSTSDGTCKATDEATVTVPAPTHSVSAVTSTGTTTYGTVSAASATVAEGSTCVITAVPASGYRVSNWAVSGEGASIDPSGDSNSNTTTLTMGTANATVTVTFEQVCYSVLYDLVEEIGSAEVTTATASITDVPSLVLSDTDGRIKLTPASGQKIKNGDEVVFTGTVGAAENKKKPFGIKFYAQNGSTNAGDIKTAENKWSGDGAMTLSGTLSNLGDGADYIFIARSGGTTTTLTSCVIRRQIDCPPACTKPAAPTALSCTDHTVNSLTFGWTKETNATGYVAKLYSDSECETQVDSKNLGDVNTVTFTGLSNSTTYYCKVQSKGNGTTYCEDGNVTAAASGATDAPSCGVVTAPTQLLVGSITADGATFTIIDDADAYNYELYVSESSTEPAASPTPIYTSDEKTKAVTGLTSGTTYYAWVRSVCDESHKSDWTASSSFKVRTNPTASFANATYIIGSGTLNMSTKFSSNSEGAVVYELKEATANAEVTSAGVFSATVAGEYVVVANQAGNSTYMPISKEATVTVLDNELSDIYIWSKASKYGGDDKCISGSAANVDPNANAASTTLSYSTLTMTNATSMGRPGDDKVVTLVFSVKAGYTTEFGIKSICAFGKLEESTGGEIRWGDGEWTHIDAYGSGDGAKRTFDAPTGTYPQTFSIRFTSASTSTGGLWWRNALVTLQAKKTVDGTVESLQNVKVNDVAISASDLTTLKNDKTLAISTEYAAAPTVTFVKRTTISYEGGWADDVVDEEIEVVASDASTVWSASQTINAQAYTVTLAKPTEPSLETAATSFTLTSTKNATDSKSFTFSGANLEHSVAITLASDVAGLSVTPANVIPDGSGAITNEEVTITYKSLENVDEANVNLIVSYSETVKLTIPLTYSSTRGWDTPNNVTGSITWDFSKAASSDVTISNNVVTVLANYDVENDPTKIVTDNLAGKGEKFSNSWLRTFYLQFTTTVNGKLAMEYSDTGSSSGRRTRYMYVNGVRYGAGSNTSASHALEDPVYVTAGTITLTAKIDTEGKEEAQWNDANVQLYQMVFVQTHDITFVDGGSIPAIHAANGETVSLPDVDAGDVPAGMSFNGWFIGDTKIGNAGDDYTMGDEDVALTAKFRTACTTPTIAWDVQPTNSRSITGTQDVSVTLTDYSGEVTWLSSEPTVATISGTDENATITYVGEGSTIITAQFIIPDGQSLCDGTYKVTKEITLMDCPEPAALTNEIARFQVPACGIDHTQSYTLTNADVERDNCTVTVSGIGGGTGNWYQNTTNNLWYAKIAGDNYYIAINVTGGIQEGDLVYVYMRAQNGGGVKINKTPAHAVTTTQNDNAEVMLEYEVASDDMEDDGSIKFLRASSNTYINRIIIVRPPCRATNITWNAAPAVKAHVGDADGTATVTSNYMTGVTYSSSNTDVATIVSGNGTNTVTIHYVAAGTTTITATVTGADPYCTDPVSVSKEIRVIGDAPASGTLYKFEVKEMADTYIFSENNASMEMTTDNYLSLLQSGELTASVSGGYNRLYISNNAFVFANSAGGQLTMSLDYPLAVGDVIKYKNVNGNNDRANLNEPRDAGRTTVLSGNGGTAIQTFDVPAAWAGATELTLTRNNNNPKIAYFEIYRRPAVTGVSVADLTVREGASVTPVMTLAPSDDALVTKQAWSILSGDDKITITPTTGVVTGVHEGDAVIKVVLNDDPTISATATVHVVETFVQQDVTESIVWDFSKAGTASAFTDQVLANVNGVTLDVTQFDARKLVGTANNITSTYFQGTMLTFNATTAGKLSVRFTNGNNNVRTLKVYAGDPEVEIASWSYSNAATENKSIDVPAGKVTLRSYQGDAPNNVRIMNLEFLALAHQRTTGYNAGDLGTVCLEDATFIEGANLYELAGLNENGYLAFDEITTGNLEAGKPYLFEVTNPSKISFYKPVGAAHSDSEIENKGMIGTFAGTTLYQGSENLYYFSGRHIWKVNDFTVAIPIPDHRCYVNYDAVQAAGPAQAPAAGRRRVTLGVQGKGTATDINNVEGDNVQPVKMMINGQLFILRGEKLYDATGRLVK